MGPSKRKAEEVAEKLHSQILARKLGVRPRLEAPTLDEFIPRFLAENYAGKASSVNATRSIMRFREFAGNIPLTAVTKGLVNEYISQRRKDRIPSPFRGKSKHSPNAKKWTPKKVVRNGTINRDVDAVKRMLSFAHELEIIEWNPLAKLKKLDVKDGKRKPMLSPEQLQALLDAASDSRNQRFLAALTLALYTGRRRSDLLKRRTADYNQTQGLLFLGKTKKGEDERIQLAGSARWALDALYDNAVTGWFFPGADGSGPIKDMDTAFRETKKRAGIDMGFRWHDLRHVAISYYVMAGVDYNTIASLVGHTTPTMIEQRYGHLSQRHRNATAVIFGGYMDRITGLESAHANTKNPGSDRSISSQVADLISGEAARGLVVKGHPPFVSAHRLRMRPSGRSPQPASVKIDKIRVMGP
ncbi:tyrosine-type recombinase/integrase [Elusimicrobiota bacterium]